MAKTVMLNVRGFKVAQMFLNLKCSPIQLM